MEYQEKTTTTNNFRSFPANYVTLAQLRERWLQERGEREDPKQLKDDQTECDCVAIAGEEETKTKSTAAEEVQSPPTDVEAGAGESCCSRVSSANRWTRKWVDQRRPRERREGGGQSRAEKSDGLGEKPEVAPEPRVSPVEENNGFNPRSRHWSAKREIGKKNGPVGHGNIRNTGSEDRSENNCLDEKDEIEARSKPPTLNSETGAGSVSNVPDHKADSEPKDGVLAVNRCVRKGNTGLRRNDKLEETPRIRARAVAETERNRMDCEDNTGPKYSGYEGEKIGKWARTNQRNWEVGSGSKSESNGFDLEADIEPKVMVMSVRGGFWWNVEKDPSLETGIEKTVERHGKDQSDESRPELKALSVNGGLKKNGKKEDLWERKNRKGGKFGGGSRSNNLDQAAGGEPKLMVMSVHSGFCRNDEKDTSPEIGIEKTVERHRKDQSDEIKPELKALSVNGGLKKNGEKEDSWERKNRKGRKFGGGSSKNLDQAAGAEPKLMVMSVHSGFWRNDEKNTSPEIGIEKTVERHGKDYSNEIRPELKALSVNGGLKKNDEKEDLWKRKNRKGRKFGGGSSNNLDQAAGVEPKLMVMSVHSGFWRNDEKDTSPETGIEKTVERHEKDHSNEIRPELQALSVNGVLKKNGEKEDLWKRKSRKGGEFGGGSSNNLDQAAGSEPKLTVMSVRGGFWRNVEKDTSLETGIETIAERNREEQRAEVEPESVNKGSKKKKKKSKKKKGPKRRDSENGQTIGEGRAETNVSLEVGVEATVEEKRDDQRVGTESESRTLSVNEGIRKKKQGGRNIEIRQTRGETRPESEPKVGVLSANDSVGKGNRGSNRNGGKEVTQEGGVKTKVERNGSKKRNKVRKNPDDCDLLTVIREDNGGGSIRNSEKVESQGAVVEPEFKALSVIGGGTRNENGGFRRKTSTSQYVGYRESRSNVPGKFGRHKKVLGKEDGVKVWVKKEELPGGKS